MFRLRFIATENEVGLLPRRGRTTFGEEADLCIGPVAVGGRSGGRCGASTKRTCRRGVSFFCGRGTQSAGQRDGIEHVRADGEGVQASGLDEMLRIPSEARDVARELGNVLYVTLPASVFSTQKKENAARRTGPFVDARHTTPDRPRHRD